jgi:hypothetical protein
MEARSWREVQTKSPPDLGILLLLLEDLCARGCWTTTVVLGMMVVEGDWSFREPVKQGCEEYAGKGEVGAGKDGAAESVGRRPSSFSRAIAKVPARRMHVPGLLAIRSRARMSIFAHVLGFLARRSRDGKRAQVPDFRTKGLRRSIMYILGSRWTRVLSRMKSF